MLSRTALGDAASAFASLPASLVDCGLAFMSKDLQGVEANRSSTDGLSNTYLVGEKYVNRLAYGTADDPGHNQSLYSGVDLDVNRWTIDPPAADDDGDRFRVFGSAHSAGCQLAFCDGSVRVISYTIDAETHRRLGNRRDGMPVPVPE